MAKAKVEVVVIEEQYKKGYVPMTLQNVEIGWSHLRKPDLYMGDEKWVVDFNLNDTLAAKCRGMGFDLKTGKNPDKEVIGNVLKAKKKTTDKAGNPQKPPTIVGLDGRTPFEEELGYGTIVNAVIGVRAWEVFDKEAGGKIWKLFAYIDAIQVVSHVPRGGGVGFTDLSGE